VIREIAAVDGVPHIIVAGYSLDGNLALKLAADDGDATGAAAGRLRDLAVDGARSMRRRAALFQDDSDGRRRLRYHSLTQLGPGATAVECIRNAAACRERRT
jgi:hypothetical protein